MAYGDIRVQRGVAVFGASADTVAVSFGSNVVVANTLLRITNVVNGSSGPNSAEVATRNCDDLGARLSNGTLAVGGFTLERVAAASNFDVRVHWEVWEYVGPVGGPNEFEVIARGGVRMLSGTASGTTAIDGLSSDYDKVTPHLVGIICEGTGTTYDQGLTTLALTKTGGSETLDYTRGDSGSTTTLQYALVDWKGSAWTVENNISHTFTAAGSNETEAITSVGDTANAMVFCTYRTAGAGLDETGWNCWFNSASSLYFRLRSGAGTTGAAAEACVVSNPGLVVQHLDSIVDTEAEHASGSNTVNITVDSMDTERTGAIATADCAGTGTAYPRQFWGYRLTSSTNLEFYRGRNGQASDWAGQVAQFLMVTGSGSATLEEATGSGTGTFAMPTSTGTGSATLEEATGLGSGTVTAPVFTGTGSATLEEATGLGAGTASAPGFTGSGAATLEEASGSGAGTFAAPVFTGTGAATLEEASGVGAGTFAAPVYTGTGAATLAATTGAGTGTATAPSTHVFDFATQVSALTTPMVVMWDLGWYGIPTTDSVPGPGPDTANGNKGYGNWWLSGTSYTASDPVTYPPVPYSTVHPELCADYYGGRARQVASYLRPYSGIYSSSGLDTESQDKRRLLDLSILRSGTDPRGRCTGWCCEVGHLPETQAGGNTPGGAGYLVQSDVREMGLRDSLAQAEALGVTGADGGGVTVAYNSGFANNYGYADDAALMAAIQTDLAYYIQEVISSSAGLRVNGRVVVFLWKSDDLTPAQWVTIFDTVRAALSHDFYVMGRQGNSAFEYSDAIWPWVKPTLYADAVGATERLKAADWSADRHDQWIAELGSYPGRVVMGSLSPGFEDWAKGFGQGLDRDVPRSLDLVQGQVDYFLANTVTIPCLMLPTWNDYPEGSVWEPVLATPAGNTIPAEVDALETLEWLTEEVGRWAGDTVDPLETAALKQPWLDWEDSRVCAAAPEAQGQAHATPQRVGEAAVVRSVGAAGIQSVTAGEAAVARTGGVAATPEPSGDAGVQRWQ